MSNFNNASSNDKQCFSRRNFISSMAGAAAALAMPKAVFARASAAGKPNFLWIDIEDLSPHLGCYGVDYVKTPRIDAFAEQGVRYINFGGPNCICAPNRSSFITGMYPTSIGTHQMRCSAVPDPAIKILPEYLRSAGYYCALTLKTDYQGIAGPQGGSDKWDDTAQKSHYDGRTGDQPFLFQRNWGGTHEGNVRTASASARSDMYLPAFLPDTAPARKVWETYMSRIEAMDKDCVGALLDELDKKGLADDTIVVMFGDHGAGMPRSKRWLYDSGFIAPLIIRIPEKFRVDGQGTPGTVSDELVSFMDLAPTMLNLAGIKVPSHMQGRAFLGPNLSPPREYLFGARDRADERYDIMRCVRDKRYKYIRNYEPWKEYAQWIDYAEKHEIMKELRKLHAEGKLKPEQEKFFASHKPWEELYDLKDDPDEVKNLAGSDAHQVILKRMRKAHEDWVLETHDLGYIPEPILNARAKSAGSHYKVGTRNGGAEAKRAWETAKLLDKGVDALDELKAALADSDDAVRYWGAIGLGNLLDKASSAVPALEKALSDTSPAVRIAAGRSLAFITRKAGKGVPAVEKEARNNGDLHVRMMAYNFMDRFGTLARNHIDNLTDKNYDCVKLIAQVVKTFGDEPSYPQVAAAPKVLNKVPARTPVRTALFDCNTVGRQVTVRIRGRSPAQLTVYNSRGARIHACRLAPGRKQTLPQRGKLSAGTYLLRVVSKGAMQEIKISIR